MSNISIIIQYQWLCEVFLLTDRRGTVLSESSRASFTLGCTLAVYVYGHGATVFYDGATVAHHHLVAYIYIRFNKI